MHAPSQPSSMLARHWFIPVSALILSGAFLVTHTAEWAQEALLVEAGLLFDLAVLLPALYFICYRSNGNAAALKSVAIACGGIWLATYLVPPEQQRILPALAFLRYGAIVVLVYIEIRIVAVLYWAIIAGRVPADEAASQLASGLGVPSGIAKFMAMEALFWRRVLAKPIGSVRKLFRRGD